MPVIALLAKVPTERIPERVDPLPSLDLPVGRRGVVEYFTASTRDGIDPAPLEGLPLRLHATVATVNGPELHAGTPSACAIDA